MLRFVVACAALAAGTAVAADLRVLAPNAVKESVVEVAAQFERATGHRVVLSWAGTEAITRRVSEGETFDVVISASGSIERLASEGKLVAGTRTDFAKSSVGAAVRASLPKPDISSLASLKQALLDAKSIAISSGTSGRHLEQLFDKLGVAEQVKPKLKQPPSGAQIGDMLARGEADLGFQQVSELIHVKGIEFLGPLPAEAQSITVYSGAIHAKAADPAAAKALLEALRAPAAAPVIRRAGMEPAQRD
jgi:molybdate transport system substrate-binding protein